jgi:hypothetical protein
MKAAAIQMAENRPFGPKNLVPIPVGVRSIREEAYAEGCSCFRMRAFACEMPSAASASTIVAILAMG